VSYPDMAMLAGAKPVIVQTTEAAGFKMTADMLEKAITPKTRALVINSPSNPTGCTYTVEELSAIAAVCVRHKILIISDEIYEKLVYDDFTFGSIAATSKEAKELCIVVNGVSKAYAMTGWRIGYAAGNSEIIAAMGKIQSQSTSNPTSIAMKAAVEALNGPQGAVERMRAEFESRRDFIVKRLNEIPGISCFLPEGAFYVFPNIKGLLGKVYDGVKINTSMEFAAYLLEKAKIAVVPGEPFGAQGFLRLSYATSLTNIAKGLDRLANAI